MIVLDTNVLSALMLRVPDRTVTAWLDRQPRTSVWTTSITVFEVRFGLEIMPNGKRRAALISDFEKFLSSIDHRVAPFDSEAAQHASSLMASRKVQGRPRDMRDTMIAGIVLSRRATLATRNIRDFDDIPATLVDPWAA
ncbi:MAG TPA: type II toxin-antitoxin system VapC family toxin [Candidatus Acidoferrum sp.]|jgi:predicted nucleic acid-binding protein|nr:type II toxin-antitoxin system VapC family toxin [Candidatus Acidoferrum sp.]